MMSAADHYKQLFSRATLKEIFAEKIAESGAVGRDGIRPKNYTENLDQEIEIILKKVAKLSFKFTGYKQKLISKGASSKPREISIPTVRDRLVLRALCNLLTETFPDSCLPPPHVYIKDIKARLEDLDNDFSFLRMDIQDYYPSIIHDILLKRIRHRVRKHEVVKLIEAAIKTPTGKKNSTDNIADKGVPQGLSISNILSSIYLINIDRQHHSSAEYHYFRFVDDILIIAPSQKCTSLDKKIRKQLTKLGLSCHPLGSASEKASIRPVSDGVDYLGYTISTAGVSVRRSSYKKMYMNLSRVFTDYKYSKNIQRFIWRLNLKITGCIFNQKRMGWMHFFSQTEDKSQLKKLDIFVQKMLRKYKVSSQYCSQVRTFIKTFHEIRFNAADTIYVPNFDNFSNDLKVDMICLLTDNARTSVEVWPIEHLEAEFRKLTSREVSRLERDLLDVFS